MTEKQCTDRRKEILAKAIIDPVFRRKLIQYPEAVFGVQKLEQHDAEALERLRKMLPALDDLVGTLAGDILCGGGGCPGLT